MSTQYTVWYDPDVFELKTVTWGVSEYAGQGLRYFKTYDLGPYRPGVDAASAFIVVPEKKLIHPKKYFILTPDKDVCLGDGQDCYTVKVELPTNEPFTVTIKDLNQRAQTNVDQVTDKDPYFKVRAFSRCTANIRVKEVNDGSVRDSFGAPFYKYGRSYIELNFKNPGF